MLANSGIDPEIRKAAEDVANKRDADVLFYSGGIEVPSDYHLLRKARANHRRPNAVLLLTTPGGDPDSAYRMARGLQRLYGGGHLVLFVDSFCKSAGTLFALGADEIVMSEEAELGPLDIQLSKPDELAERISGLIPIQALNTLRQQMFQHFEEVFLKLRFRSSLQISTRTAADIAAKLTAGLFRPVYQQLDPMRLGEIQRAMMIGHKYGQRLDRGNLKDGSLNTLIASYPSHGFIIDRVEAETLFCKVSKPSDEEIALAGFVDDLVVAGLEEGTEVAFLSESRKGKKGGEHDKTNEVGAKEAISGEDAKPTGRGSVPLAGDRVGESTRPAGNSTGEDGKGQAGSLKKK